MTRTTTPQHRGRRALYAVISVCLGLLLATTVTGVVFTALLAQDSRTQVGELRTQLQQERAATIERSKKAAADRRDLQQQNRQLRRQLDAVLGFLEAQGLKLPASGPAGATTSPSDGGSAASTPAQVQPSRPGATTRPGRPSTPQPTPVQPPAAPTAPAEPADPVLVCVLRLCVP